MKSINYHWRHDFESNLMKMSLLLVVAPCVVQSTQWTDTTAWKERFEFITCSSYCPCHQEVLQYRTPKNTPHCNQYTFVLPLESMEPFSPSALLPYYGLCYAQSTNNCRHSRPTMQHLLRVLWTTETRDHMWSRGHNIDHLGSVCS
jgi:hypothetical protein